MDLFNFSAIIFLCYISTVLGITTTHHNKPEESSITNMATMMSGKPELTNITLTAAERAKRLLPYESFYQIQPFNRPSPEINFHASYPDALYKPEGGRFTPFLGSNAIPGAFTPMVHQPRTPESEVPNFSAIYDDLAQLRLGQNGRRPDDAYRAYQADRMRYFDAIQPTKTTIETFTATSIDVPSGPNYGSLAGRQIVSDVPRTRYPARKPPSFVIVPAPDTQPAIRKPVIVIQRRPNVRGKHIDEAPKFVRISSRPNQFNFREPQSPEYEQPTYYHRGSPKLEQFHKYDKPKAYQTTTRYEDFQKIPPQNYVALGDLQATNTLPKLEQFQKFPQPTEYQTTTRYEDFQKVPSPTRPQNYVHLQQTTETLPIAEYEEPTSFQRIPPTPAPQNSVPLGDLLKHLQATNTLPKTLTADNIDNSIKTLVRILDALKKRQRTIKPIVVQEQESSDYEEDIDNEAGVGISGYPAELPGTQSYPLDTEEGGTPGKAGVDYPALSTIPQTNFNCKTQRYKGFFGDPDTNCQVWHYCDLNGGQASFLCPNGTIFSQVALTCDWWFNVKCATTSQLYVLNERLYKYIIPLSPKFPEDYSGPLVDKYLALKYQEMEEKMRKEKKGKGNSMEDVSSDGTEKVTMLESSTASSQKETLQSIEDDSNRS